MKNIGSYPNTRLRRNRKKEWSRRLVQENTLSSNDLIWPIFICEGKNVKEPIKTMPGVYRHSIDRLEKSRIEKLIVCNTIEIDKQKIFNKIKIVSVADVFGEAIRRIVDGTSLSSMFK